jgi:Secretion system C-terminal sorting domain
MSKAKITNNNNKETNMKKTALFFVLSILLLLPNNFYAQHEMVVPPATSLDDALNLTIMNDVDGSGARNDPERVYVLQDGVYIINAPIVNDGWPLTIVSESGSELKPMIVGVPDNTNTMPSRMVDMRGDVTFKNIRFVNYYEDVYPDDVVRGVGQVITANAAGFNIDIDNCILSCRSILQTSKACVKVKVTNSILGEMFMLAGSSDWGGGKCFDMRNSSCDSVIIVNNTFVNEQDRIFRQRGAGAGVDVNHFIFDHNTIVDCYSYHGCIEIGRSGESAQITNNVFYNPFALCNDTDITRQAEFEDNTELDPYGGNKMALVSTIPSDTTQFTIRNNYVATTQQQEDWYAKWADASASPRLPYNSSLPDYLTDFIAGKIPNASTAFVKENIAMNNVPVLGTAIMDWYRTPIGQGGAGKTKVKVYTDISTLDCDRKSMAWLTDTLDCSYNTNAAAYTGADGGQPAGDLRWWGLSVGVKQVNNVTPSSFSLKQNYPNPFNPVTNITYSIPQETHVTVEVYDILGRLITKLVNSTQKAGTYNVDFDASRLASGTYIYRLSTPEVTYAKKMLLMK